MTAAADIILKVAGPARHGEAAELRGLTLSEPLDLSGRLIAGVDFSGTTFGKAVSFRGSTFGGLSWFRSCVFLDGADFTGASFANDARFDGSIFNRDLGFARTDALGATEFRHCRIDGATDFRRSRFSGNMSIAGARFRGNVTLREVECLGGFWSDGAVFEGRIDAAGMDVHGRAWLRNIAESADASPANRLVERMTCYGFRHVGRDG